MLSNKITVCIFAWNEEARLERCINNFKDFFKILVVDNGSVDGTLKLARQLGVSAVTIPNPGFIETPSVMDPLMDSCETDFLLIASVSEFVPLELMQKYAEVANSDSYDVVRAYRQSITAGMAIPISGLPTFRQPGELRFFRKGAVDFSENQVHGRGRAVVDPSRVLRLVSDSRFYFYQFRDYDWSHTELKHRGYNDVLSKQMFEAGRRFSWVKMCYYSTKQFLNAYIRFGCWKYGTLGFIHSFHRAYMEMGIWFRIWEWEHGLQRSGVIQKNNNFREALEKKIVFEERNN